MTLRATKTREIVAIGRSRRAVDGNDFHTRRARVPRRGGPFLSIEEVGPVDWVAEERWRRRSERRRNLQSLTYLLEGEWVCSGETGPIMMRPGDVCWRSTQSEGVRRGGPTPKMLRRGGRLHCLEVMLRLPPGAEVRHGGKVARAVAIDETTGPARVRVLVGSLLSIRGAFDAGRNIAIADWFLSAGASVSFPVTQPRVVVLYVHQDVVWIGSRGLALREGQVAVLGPGEQVILRGPEQALRPAQVLFLAGPRS